MQKDCHPDHALQQYGDCSVIARTFQPLLFFLAGSTENELRKQVEFLRAENQMLRRRVPKKRTFLSEEERNLLLKLGKAIGPGVRHLITIVHPRTYQRWISGHNRGKAQKRMGRTKTIESVREIIVRIAKETGWGYLRILGELKKLCIRCVSRTTIKNILKEEGIGPGPKRGRGSWHVFLKMHAETLWQVDFFSKCIWTPKGLRQCFVLAFLHVATRKAYVSPCSFKPDAQWMEREVEAFLNHARGQGIRIDHVTRDRDGKFVIEFDSVLKSAGGRIIRTAPQAPNQNAFVERWVKSIREECLHRFLVFGQRHFDFLISSYVDFYNRLRPHQGVDNWSLSGSWSEENAPLGDGEHLVCHSRLGRLLRHYERRAA